MVVQKCDKPAGERDMSRKVENAMDAAARQRARRENLTIGRRELCDYVAAISLEFAHLTKSHELRFLSYLLALVSTEAANQSRALLQAPPQSADDDNGESSPETTG
jgi:hypothetical protein